MIRVRSPKFVSLQAGCLPPSSPSAGSRLPWKEALAVQAYNDVSSQTVGRCAPSPAAVTLLCALGPLPLSSVMQGEAVGTDLLWPDSGLERPPLPPPDAGNQRPPANHSSLKTTGSPQALGHCSVPRGFSTSMTLFPEGKPGCPHSRSGRQVTLSGHHPGSHLPPHTPPPGVDTCPAAWGELLRTGGCSNEVTLHPSQVPGQVE